MTFAIAGVTPGDGIYPDLTFPPYIRRVIVPGQTVGGGIPPSAPTRYAVVGRSRISSADATWYLSRLGVQASITLYDFEEADWVTVSGKIDSPQFDTALPGPNPYYSNFRVNIVID